MLSKNEPAPPRQPLRIHSPNYFFMFLAVLAAIGLWYYISVRDRIEAEVEVKIDYYGIPPNLVVTDGLIKKLYVRLKGPESLIRSIPTRLTDAIDLSKIKKGVTIVPTGGEALSNRYRAFDIVDIQPPRITITADNLIERSVGLTTDFVSPLPKGELSFAEVSTDPGRVVIRGPESVVSHINTIKVIVHPDTSKVGQKEHQQVILDTPSLVTASPPNVVVYYKIISGRVLISRECKIVISGDTDGHYEASPSSLSLMVEIPEDLEKDKQYLDQLEASVVPPPIKLGESKKMRIRLRMPEGMKVLNQSQMDAVITKIKD